MSDINWDLANLTGEPQFRGAIDGMTDEWVYGWVIEATDPQNPVELEIFLYDQPVLRAVCDIRRDDISGFVKLPVKAGFSAPLRDIAADTAQLLLKRLKADGPGKARIADILRIEVRGTGKALPFSPNVTEISREALHKTLSPAPGQFPGGEPERIRLRDGLLATAAMTESPPVKVLAYYLPQFHPFAENNEWWGEGFTEWTNVTAAKPLFDDHYQPHLPADFGFYDLRLDQVQRDQIALAKSYGVAGFCYYYYWFSGQTLMTLPIDRHVEQDLDIDFCLCWANESWSRRWDGSENDVLMAQRHSYDSDVEFIRSCLKYFASPRYIKIDGAPVLQVYRISLMKNPTATIKRWREIVREAGFPDLHVSMVESFGLTDPGEYGCDSSCQFPPHGVVGDKINEKVEGLAPDYSGTIYDYAEIVRGELARPAAPHVRFRAAMPAWDNTSRKGAAGNVFAGSSPALFETWMKHLVAEARNRLPEGQRFVFVNAWNEWAEGTHLEPDRKYGHAHLRAVRNALAPENVALAPLLPPPAGQPDPLADTRRYVESLVATNKMLTKLVAQTKFGMRVGEEISFVQVAPELIRIETVIDQRLNIDVLNGRAVPNGMDIPLAGWQGLGLRGWFLLNDRAAPQAMIGLRSAGTDGTRYLASIHAREERADVAAAFSLGQKAHGCGFTLKATLQGVAPGRYEIEIIVPGAAEPRRARAIGTDITLLIG